MSDFRIYVVRRPAERARVGLWCGLALGLFVWGFAPGPVIAQTAETPPLQVAPADVRASVPSADAAPGKDKKPASWWASVDACLQDVVSIATSILVIVSYLALFAAGMILLCFVCRELRKKIVIIEPFEVPPSVAATGLTGAALVTQIKQRIDEIRDSHSGLSIRLERSTDGRTAPPVDFRMETATDLLILEASAAGFSTRDVMLFLRKVFNRPPIKVSGHLIAQGLKPILLVEMRLQSASRVYEVIAEDLLQAVAERILSRIDPGSIANYFASMWKLDSMEELSHEMSRSSATRDELLNAWNLRGFVALAAYESNPTIEHALYLYSLGEAMETDFRKSAASQLYRGVAASRIPGKGAEEGLWRLKRAVKMDPYFLEARFYLGFELQGQGKPEEAVKQYTFVLSVTTHPSKLILPKGVVKRAAWRIVLFFRRKVGVDAFFPNILSGQALFYRALARGEVDKSQVVLDEVLDDYDALIRMGENVDAENWIVLITNAMYNKAFELGKNDPQKAIAQYDSLISRYVNCEVADVVETVAKAGFNKALAIAKADARSAMAVYAELIARYETRQEFSIIVVVARSILNMAAELSKTNLKIAFELYDKLIALYESCDLPEIAEPVANAMFNKAVELGRTDPLEAVAQFDRLLARYGTRQEVGIAELAARSFFNKAVLMRQAGSAHVISELNELIVRYGEYTAAAIVDPVSRGLILRWFTICKIEPAEHQRVSPTDSEFQALVTEWQTRNPAVAAQLLPALQSLTDPPPETLPGDG